MKVLLIDIDSKIPNLALMKISAYHKSQGHDVSFNEPDPDKIYVSTVFRKNRWKASGIEMFYPDVEVCYGGSGYDLGVQLPDEIEFLMPDYSLYDCDYSMGFTTRGCIRRCKFCIVPTKEGKLVKWQHPREFHDPGFDTIMLLDNNWYADKGWFMETSQWIIDNDLAVIEHGMDIRILTRDVAERLAEVRWNGTMHFAFDSVGDEKAVRKGIKLLEGVGINLKHSLQFYVLVGYNTTEEEDKYRCRLLKELGTNAFVMPYVKNKWTRKIARWANRKWAFWSCDIDEYKRSVA